MPKKEKKPVPRVSFRVHDRQLYSDLRRLCDHGTQEKLFEVCTEYLVAALKIDKRMVMGGLFSKELAIKFILKGNNSASQRPKKEHKSTPKK